MLFRQLSLRSILLLVTSTLTLLVIALVARQVYVEWQKLAEIRSLKEAIALSDRLFDASAKLSAERDIAYSMLYALDKEDMHGLQQQLERSRRETDAAIETTLQDLEKYDFPEIYEKALKDTRQFQAIQILRRQIDSTVVRPAAERDPALRHKWFAETTDLGQQIQDLTMQFTRHFNNIDPTVSLHMRFKHFLANIVEYSSRERALIGRLIAENADISSQERADLLRWQSAAQQGWEESDLLADDSRLYPAIQPYFKDAESHYFNLYDMVKNIFYVPGAPHGKSYPISVDLWLELSTQTTDSLYALKDAALKETQNYTTVLETRMKHQMLVHFLVLLLALGTCTYSFWLVTVRVITPINTIVGALIDAIEGKSVSLLPFNNRHDEIGKLVTVLHAFQQNLEKVKQAEKTNALLAAIVESSDDAIFSKTLDGDIMSWNPGAARLLGYSAEEVVGKNVSMLIPPELRENEKLIANKLSYGTKVEHYDTVRRHKDGHDIYVSLTLSPIRDSLGNIVAISKIMRDITEQKKAEQKLKRYTQALERSNKELDDFAYIASHDLKEPLRGIHNHARFLLEDNSDKLDEESVSRLERLTYLSQRMERLVNDLLYFSRLGRQEMAVGNADINAIIKDIESTLDVFLEEHHAYIVVPEPLPTVICDKTRITEVFRNLITNGIKYNDSEKKRIEIGFIGSKTPPDSTIPLKDVFYVKDNGKGIAPGFHEEVFRIFKRLQNSKGPQEGTGVGLTFVKKIIERHGGKIWLESEVGKGTTFYFTLKSGDYDIKSTL